MDAQRNFTEISKPDFKFSTDPFELMDLENPDESIRNLMLSQTPIWIKRSSGEWTQGKVESKYYEGRVVVFWLESDREKKKTPTFQELVDWQREHKALESQNEFCDFQGILDIERGKYESAVAERLFNEEKNVWIKDKEGNWQSAFIDSFRPATKANDFSVHLIVKWYTRGSSAISSKNLSFSELVNSQQEHAKFAIEESRAALTKLGTKE